MTATQMTPLDPIPATRNEAWGFWGTMQAQAADAWAPAMTTISDATYQPFESVRAFLDSAHGRHFADEVHDELHAGSNLVEAIQVVTQRWMTWTTQRRICKDYRMPRGMPYLTAFVIHCEIGDESRAA